MHNFIKKMTLLCLRKFNSDATDYVQSTQPTQTTQTNLYTVCYRKIRRHISFFITPIILSSLIACGGGGGGGGNTDTEVPTAPASPASAAATPLGFTSLRVTWDSVPQAERYEVYDSNGVNVATVRPPATSYTATGLSPNTEYTYSIKACNSASCSTSAASSAATSGNKNGGDTIINSAAELNAIRADSSTLAGNYILAADIDLSDIPNWQPIGDSANGFTGSFDGSGYEISGMTISGYEYAGLFGYVHGASISNLGVNVNNINSSSTHAYAGGLAAQANRSFISNVYVIVAIDITSSAESSSYAGGLFGRVDNSRISNSYVVVYGSIYSSVSEPSASSYAGGLVGYADSSSISNSYYSARPASSQGDFTDTTGTSGVAKTVEELKELTAESTDWDKDTWYFGTANDLPKLSSDFVPDVEPPPVNVPASPRGVTVVPLNSTSIRVSWNSVSDVEFYKVYNNRGGSVNTTPPATSYTATDLLPNTGYTYRVAACNDSGCSAFTSRSAAIPIPASPSIISAAGQDFTSVTITWSKVLGTKRYEVYKGAAKVATVDESRTTYIINKDLLPATKYTYSVKACNDVGCSDSTEIDFFTDSIDISSAPQVTVVDSTIGQANPSLELSWNYIRVVTSYQIFDAAENKVATVQSPATTHIITDLSAGILYEYKVRGCYTPSVTAPGAPERSEICGNFSAVGSATTPVAIPATPSGVAAAVQGLTSIRISWDSVVGATSYEVYNGDVLVTTINNPSTTSYTATALLPATEYTYSVKACNTSGCSDSASAATTRTPVAIPAVPSNVAAAVQGLTSIRISWDSVDGAEYYEVHNGNVLVANNTHPNTSYTATDLSPDTEYTYSVKACNVSGCSDSASTATTRTPVAIPAVPSNVAAAVQGLTSIRISWDSVDGAEYYEVHNGNVLVANKTHPNTSYTVSGLLPATEYTYSVKACNLSGCSDSASAATTRTPVAIPAVPSNVAAAVQGLTSIRISWDSVVGAEYYEVHNGNVLVANKTHPNTRHTATDLLPATEYTYSVKACNLSGCSVAASAATTRTPVAIPAVPSNVAAAVQGLTSIRISWDSVDGAEYYEVHNGNVLVANKTHPNTSYTATDLLPATEYTYSVKACNLSGCSVAASAATTPTPVAIPDSPSSISAAGQDFTSISITWNSVDGAEYYEVHNGNVLVANNTHPNTRHTATDLLPNTEYTYGVKACNTSGCSDSTEVDFFSPPIGISSAPEVTVVASTIGQANPSLMLSWGYIRVVTSYQIFDAAGNADENKVATVPDSKTSHIITDLSAGTLYEYRVRGCYTPSAPGSTEICGDFSAVGSATTPVAIPDSSGGVTIGSLGFTSISITWGEVSGATSYQVHNNDEIVKTIKNPETTIYTATDLSPNKEYTYSVKACNTSGCSVVGEITATTKAIGASSAPRITAVTSTIGQAAPSLNVSWDDISGVTSYQIFDAAENTDGNKVATVPASKTSHIIADLSAGAIYTYKVRGCYASSAESAEVCGDFSPAGSTTAPVAIPDSPSIISAGSLSLTARSIIWGAVSGAASYEVYKGNEKASTINAPTTSYTATALLPATKYTYSVKACNTSGCSDPTEVSFTTDPIDVSSAPQVTVVTSTIGQANPSLNVSWDRITGVTSYQIFDADENADENAAENKVATVPTPNRSHIITNLSAGTLYEYKVRGCYTPSAPASPAESTEICGEFSPVGSATTPVAIPDVPGNVAAASLGFTSIRISWDSVEGTAFYEVNNSDGLVIVINHPATSYTATGLLPNTEYTYRVKTCNPSVCSSTASATAITNGNKAGGATSISSAAELAAIRANDATLAGNYALTGNINLSSIANWQPIGNGTNKFTGSFNGNGYNISGVSSSGYKYAGLFGSVQNANISNVGVLVGNISSSSSSSSNSYSGGLVGYASNSPISNSYAVVKGSISSIYISGGLVGYASNSPISNSYVEVTGNISSSSSYSYSGGLVGLAQNSPISNSYAVVGGSISSSSSTYSSSGGLVGEVSSSEISNSYAVVEGSISSRAYSGGLIGLVSSSEISNSYALVGGSISSYSYSGGLVGYANANSPISNSYALVADSISSSGEISSSGGIVGVAVDSPISNSYALVGGSISSSSYSGGLVGFADNDSPISDSYYSASRKSSEGEFSNTHGTSQTLAKLRALTADATDWEAGIWDFGTDANLPTLRSLPSPAATRYPTNLGDVTATALSLSSISMSWSSVVGATSYEVYNIEGLVGSTSHPATSYAATNLLPATQYTYRVRACNLFGCSDFASDVSATTETIGVSDAIQVTLVASTIGRAITSLKVSWDSIAGVTSYQIVNRAGEEVATVSPQSTEYIVAGLAADTLYEYQVRGCYDSGVSASPPESSEVCGELSPVGSATTSRFIPSAPSRVTATVLGITSLSISWNSVEGATSYQVHNSGVLVATIDAPATSYTTRDLLPNTRHTYRVKACNGSSCSASVSTSATTKNGVLINSAAELAAIRSNSNTLARHYALTRNIDLSSMPNWRPIGDGTNAFTGSFNGNGYNISGVSSSGYQHAGLFGYAQNANIRNIGVLVGDISSTSSGDFGSFSGGLVGYARGSRISNSYAVVKGSISSRSSGGLVGRASDSSISNSYAVVEGSISSSSPYIFGSYSGGLVGSAYTSSISNSYAVVKGSISSSGDFGSFSGGLVGYADSSPTSNSYAVVKGRILSSAASSSSYYSSYSYSGGLFGRADNSPISNSYALVENSISSRINTTYLTNSIDGSSPSSYSGGLVGYAWRSPISNTYAVVEGSISSSSSPAGFSYSSYSYSGGLVGYAQDSPISNSYALVTSLIESYASFSSSYSYSGGLVGLAYTSEGSLISNSYAVVEGSISSYPFNTGGLVGGVEDRRKFFLYGIISKSYYSASTSSGEAFSNTHGTSQTLTQLRHLTASATNWNAGIWDFGTDANLPILRSLPSPAVIIPLASPEDFTATAWGLTSISISWDWVGRATSYEVHNSEGLITTINRPTTTSYAITGLLPDTEYTYRVRACNLFDCSDFVSASAVTMVVRISSALELAAIRSNRAALAGDYALTGNIDLSHILNWEPIGNSANRFTGSFDGNGYNIGGISSRGYQYAGLFGYVENANISNVGVLAGSISSTSSGDSYTGGLVGYASSSQISNSYAVVEGSISSTSSGFSASGGLVGYARSSEISKSYAVVEGSISSSYFSGALVGRVHESPISNSYALVGGSILSSDYSGGLVGHAYASPISNSYALVEDGISSSESDYSGGLVGIAINSQISKSYYSASHKSSEGGFDNTHGTSQTVAQLRALTASATDWDAGIWDFGTDANLPTLRSLPSPAATRSPANLGDVTAAALGLTSISISWDSVDKATSYEVYNSGALVTTIDAPATSHTFTDLLPDTQYTYRVRACNLFGCSAFASDVSATTMIFRISSAAELAAIHTNSATLAADYTLTGNIDLSHIHNWKPIGDKANKFTGSFDGNGYNISGVSSSGYQHAGLFGWVEDAIISNVGVLVGSISSTSPNGFSSSGALVGRAGSSEISNSYAVVAGSITSDSNSGGLVGNAVYSVISNSYAVVEGNILSSNLASNSRSGGLVGYADNSPISNSYAVVGGSISSSSSSYSYSGGLVGYAYNNSPISNSYAVVTGNISSLSSSSSSASGSYSGGLVGWSSSSGPISDSYAVVEGSISSTSSSSRSYSGGLVGLASSSIPISTSYYSASRKSSEGAFSNTYGTLQKLAELRALTASATGWNAGIWDFGTAANLPTLRSLPSPAPAIPGDVTATALGLTSISISWGGVDKAKSYEVHNGGALVTTIQPPASSYTATGLLPDTQYTYRVRACNLFGCSAFASASAMTTRATSISSVAGLTSIRTNSASLSGDYALTGNIDLSDISNWQPIGNRTNKFTGSFNGNGYNISGISSTGYEFAGLFGYVKDASISNVGVVVGSISSSSPSGFSNSGGLIGRAVSSEISNTYAVVEGSISANSNSGGLVGRIEGGSISNSYALVGDNISSSSTSSSRSGGLVGWSRSSEISNSYAVVGGSILSTSSGSSNSGGLVGLIENTPISNSYAVVEGSISSLSSSSPPGDSNSGGLVGFASGGSISNSYALVMGDVSSSSNSRGLVGGASGISISNSYYSASRKPSEGGFTNTLGTSQTVDELRRLTADATGWDAGIWDFGTDANLPTLHSLPSSDISAILFPASPEDVTATALSLSSISMSWGSVDRATSYEVYNGGALVTTIDAPATNYGAIGLLPNTQYTYRVRACNVFGCSDFASDVSATTGATVGTSSAPQVTLVASTIGRLITSLRVSWDSIAGVTSYQIVNLAGEEVATVPAPSTEYVVAGLSAGTLYEYKVRGCYDSGVSASPPESSEVCGELSPVGSATTSRFIPSAPSGVTATVLGITSLSISWNSVEGAVTYQVHNSGVLVTTIDAPATSYTTRDLLPNTGYTYSVKACHNTDCSASVSTSATTENGITISSAADLAAIRADSTSLSGDYALTGNIDLSHISNWQPIGDVTNKFTGSFDGNGYNISGVSSSGYEHAGLFGYVEGVSIRNIGVLVGSISSTSSSGYSSSSFHSGGLVGRAVSSEISNSYAVVKGSISSSSPSRLSSSGGLVGRADSSEISNSYAVVGGSISSNANSGGLAGVATSNSPISNSYAVVGGSISSDYGNSGGLVGTANSNSPISNSYAVVGGSISADSNAGGLVGSTYNSPITKSYYSAIRKSSEGAFTNSLGTSQKLAELRALTADATTWDAGIWDFGTAANLPTLRSLPSPAPAIPGDVTATALGLTSISISWGSVDKATSYEVYNSGALVTTIHPPASSYTATDLLPDTQYTYRVRACNFFGCSDFTSASATTMIFRISSVADLAAIRTDSNTLAGDYALTGNIDLSHISNWQPIGDPTNAFTGSFDGNGYNISGVSSSGYEYAGLFGYVQNANISNVGVLVGNISSSSPSSNSYSGGLVGRASDSQISNSYAVVEGVISSSASSAGVSFSGGLVGRAYNSPISNSYAVVEGVISSSSSSSRSHAGGLVGLAFTGSLITNSYALVEGSISSSTSSTLSHITSSSGGLVGRTFNQSPIINSYAIVEGSILSSGGSSNSGGLVGRATYNSPISNSYAVVEGSISSTSSSESSNSGGLVGYASDSPISNSYYSASHQSSEGGFSNTNGTSQTVAQLRALTAASTTWDENIWDFGTDANLPKLRSLSFPVATRSPASPGDVTATALGLTAISISWSSVDKATSYEVYNSSGLVTTIEAPATNYVATGLLPEMEYTYRVRACNLFGCSDFASASAMTMVASISSAADLAAIRTNSNTLDGDYALTGNIDLSDIPNWQPIGGFPNSFTGSFNGNGYNISGVSSSGYQFAGLFGYVRNANISNVGVLVGNISSLSLSSSLSYSGGLVGSADNSPISNSYAVVEGSISSLLSSSSSSFSLSASSGGLVGSADNSPVSNSYAVVEGSISSSTSSSFSSSSSGGLVGDASFSPISNSYAVVEGSISSLSSSSFSSSSSGGLVGWVSSSEISNSYAVVVNDISSITYSGSNSYSGGLVAFIEGNSPISKSYYSAIRNSFEGEFTNTNGTSQTLAELRRLTADATTWDEVVWDFGTNNDLPTLRSSHSAGIVSPLPLLPDPDTDNGVGKETNRDTDGDGTPDHVDTDDDDDNYSDALDVDDDGDGLIEIATAEQLNQVRHNLLGSSLKASAGDAGADTGCGGLNGITECNGYELVADISLAGYNSNNWLPIGSCPTFTEANVCTDVSALFNTVFDGNGYTISNLTITNSIESYTNATGLFGAISPASQLRNIHVRSANLIGGANNVGVLVGYAARASIIDSSAVGEITAYGANVGGLVGFGWNTTIISSYAAGGAIVGVSGVGGLIGSGERATISLSYAAGGDVGGIVYIGGLVGSGNSVTISLSYAAGGHVAGALGGAGGLVGEGESARVISSYAAGGNVSGLASIGGLIGSGEGATIISSYAAGGAVLTGFGVGDGLVGSEGVTATDSYWDSDTTGVAAGIYGLPQTTSELQTPTSATGIYANWATDECDDGGDAWDFGTASQYPVLTCTPGGVEAQRQR